MTKTYDTAVRKLVDDFCDDAPRNWSEEERHGFALHIQTCIEDFMENEPEDEA